MLSMINRKQSTIRIQLTRLVVCCVLPVWLIAGFLVFHAYSSKRAQVNKDMLATARLTTMVIDKELSSVQAALLALATSPSFIRGDFGDIYRQATELLKLYPGADIIVADRTGQQLVNTYRPYGTALPKRNNLDMVRRIFEDKKPIVSNLFYGAITRRPLIAIDVPVFDDGKVVYDLSMTFSSDRLGATLSGHKLPTDWYSTILDSNKVLVARTLNPKKNVGRPATNTIRQAMAKSAEGVTESVNVEGIPVFVAFSQSSLSGWSVLVGVPKAAIMTEIYRWMGWAIGGATVISLVGILFAVGIARKIAKDIQALVDPALSIGHGELVIDTGLYSVQETVEVAEALVQASELLQSRSTERDNAEKQLHLTFEKLNNETIERIRAIEELREKDKMLLQQSRLAAMGEMINNIAHQWRQPLNLLGLHIQSLSLFYGTDSFSREFLEKTVSDSMTLTRHMSQTIDDFSNFFKPDKEKTDFNVNQAIRQTINLVEDGFKQNQIKIITEIDVDAWLYGYPNEFSQVILNVLQNARDALVEREVTDKLISIAASVANGKTVITIADNAGGIREDIIDRIFEPYFSTKGVQGTGIGLFMSKSIIETNMGGSITVSNSAAGAVFRIEV